MASAKKFDPAKRKKLNNPERLRWIPPHLVWELVNSGDGSLYLDIGAGTGYLTREIAKYAGPAAKIFALDIEPVMISEMEKNLPKDSIVRPALMDRDELSFADGSVDGIWLIALYHELTPPDPLLAEIRRVIRPGCKLVIIDWEKDSKACEQGPPLDHRVSASTVIGQLKSAGFLDVMEIDGGFQHHFAVTGRG
ncbi:class I SAM-dependent methyltransferase [Desulfomarina sp.]